MSTPLRPTNPILALSGCAVPRHQLTANTAGAHPAATNATFAEKPAIADGLCHFTEETTNTTTNAVWNTRDNVNPGLRGYFVEDCIVASTSRTEMLVAGAGLGQQSSPAGQADGGAGGTTTT